VSIRELTQVREHFSRAIRQFEFNRPHTALQTQLQSWRAWRVGASDRSAAASAKPQVVLAMGFVESGTFCRPGFFGVFSASKADLFLLNSCRKRLGHFE